MRVEVAIPRNSSDNLRFRVLLSFHPSSGRSNKLAFRGGLASECVEFPLQVVALCGQCLHALEVSAHGGDLHEQ